MKLKDYVYDPDRKVATIWIDETERVQLENLLMILMSDNPEEVTLDKTDFDTIIFVDK